MMDSTSHTADREIVSTRVFDAPRERVFKAWTDPDHLVHWWGPKGFTNSFHEFDPRPGGNWRFTMHGPNGVDFPNESRFLEIVRSERIVFRHLSSPQFLVTVTFTEQEGKTLLVWKMLFETAAEFDKVRSYAIEGNQQNLDRLHAYLAIMT